MRWVFFFMCVWAIPAWAGVEQLGQKEFNQLAADLAPKVNLFKRVWEQDPSAEFYGGTTRDYLYWIKGKFQHAQTPADAQKIAAELRAEKFFDVRGFIIGDSDVDVVSTKPVTITATDYGVRKFDQQSTAIFDPATQLGFNEKNQGYAPAEKIRLGREGLLKNPGMGDGAAEIFTGKLTVTFAAKEKFAATKFAKEGINHPVLLALRYLRLSAINYYRTHGAAYPNMSLLLGELDPVSAAQVKEVIAQATKSGELTPLLENQKFQSWVNGTIQKAFRSYTNPTAARELMNHFGVDHLALRYNEKIEPLNQYVFAKHRDPEVIAANFKRANVEPESIYVEPAQAFSDGFLYHGTKTETAFRGIIFQGVLPSTSGTADGGLYGVAVEKKAFSETFGGRRDLLLRFPVKPEARIIDLTSGAGQALWAKWPNQADFDGFAAAYGADILKYPYERTEAFVVKNSVMLGRAEGVYRQTKPFSELLALAPKISSPQELLDIILINNLNKEEKKILTDLTPIDWEQIRQLMRTPDWFTRRNTLEKEKWQGEVIASFLSQSAEPADQAIALKILAGANEPAKESLIAFALNQPAWLEQADFLRGLLLTPKPTWPEQNLVRSLSATGFWEKNPEILAEAYRAGTPIVRSFALAVGPKNWRNHLPLLREVYREYQPQKGASKLQEFRKILSTAISQCEGLKATPEIFLNWNLEMKDLGGADWEHWKAQADLSTQSDASPWKGHPFLKELAGTPDYSSATLIAPWRTRKLAELSADDFLKLRSISDPAQFLDEFTYSQLSFDTARPLAMRSHVKPEDIVAYLTALNQTGSIRSKAALKLFAVDSTAPELKAFLLNCLQPDQCSNANFGHLISDVLLSPRWLEQTDLIEAYLRGMPDSFLREFAEGLGTRGFFDKNPGMFRDLLQNLSDRNHAILVAALTRMPKQSWDAWPGLFRRLAEGASSLSGVGRLNHLFSGHPFLETAENWLDLFVATRKKHPALWNQVRDHILKPKWNQNPEVLALLGGQPPTADALADAWEKKRATEHLPVARTVLVPRDCPAKFAQVSVN